MQTFTLGPALATAFFGAGIQSESKTRRIQIVL
jgi:hypothetical protein